MKQKYVQWLYEELPVVVGGGVFDGGKVNYE